MQNPYQTTEVIKHHKNETNCVQKTKPFHVPMKTIRDKETFDKSVSPTIQGSTYQGNESLYFQEISVQDSLDGPHGLPKPGRDNLMRFGVETAASAERTKKR